MGLPFTHTSPPKTAYNSPELIIKRVEVLSPFIPNHIGNPLGLKSLL